MKFSLTNLLCRTPGFTLSLDVAVTGDIIGVLGPSGSGKTTLLEIVAGLRPAQEGRVSLDGRDLSGIPARRRRIGYVPQDLALFPHLSVRQNLAYGMPRGSSRLEQVAEMFELQPLLDRSPSLLSGGEKQRAAFARAVLAEPHLLLLDEPLSSLDAPLKERLFPHLLRIRDDARIPMLYVTHSADEAMRLCDQLLVLDGGLLAAAGDPRELLIPSPHVHYRLKSPL